MSKTMFPPSITNLLLAEGQRFQNGDALSIALGTGVIPIVATARGGKTSLAYVMLDYVIRYTNRPVILDSFPQRVIDEGIPDHWKGRVYNTHFEDIASIDEPAVGSLMILELHSIAVMQWGEANFWLVLREFYRILVAV